MALALAVGLCWGALAAAAGGIHTLQLHVNCALDGDTPVRGHFHFAFDGQDFLILERNQSAWVPLAPGAINETHYWDTGHTWTLFAKEFLQEECVATLRSLLQGGTKALGWQVPPGMSVTYRHTPHGSTTLSCHARGFYPRPIRVSWVRDGAEILPPMNASGILPNADSTYQIQQSLEIPPRWGHSYACRVQHSSLVEPALTMGLPEVSVSRRDAPDGSATLSCRAQGFDPHPIHVSWVQDGKETPAPPICDPSQLQRSVGIPQQGADGHSYSCRVQHCGLQEALATTAPRELGGLAPGILATLGLAALTVASAAVAGFVVWRRKRLDSGRNGFTPTSKEDPAPGPRPACQRQTTSM
ncbi:class I histocompatibility antigen, F10 alpha chain-like isoform X3 [Dermochelys coriacea]|uniref:class I histocompatibility antigen, F10 alpha chain-like isoform X3 n=1 Tax=Dermochelys coriacea TaxID=27794 RepID=UPI0018E70056|nr:class I histocompatibility antigen, F10 alpha chain-like isoform X3 [Dermochelys coriacea]